jgi:FkbM family methyltransferase
VIELLLDRLTAYLRHVRTLGLYQTWRYVLRRLRGAQVAALRIQGISTPVFIRVSSSDPYVLWQVLEDRHFEVALRYSPELIIDGGANIGLVSLYFANRYPDAKIIAIEPDPENCALFRRNCSAYPNIELVQGALWPSNADLVIENPNDLSYEFRVVEAPSSTSRSFRGVTMEDVLANSGKQRIDLLKLDIEGSEAQLFSFDHNNWLSRVDNMMIEIHGELCRNTVLSAVENEGFAVYQSGEYDVFTRVEKIQDTPSKARDNS